MNDLKNENLLNLIFKNFSSLDNKHLFVDAISNKTVLRATLRTLSYQEIYQSMGRSKNILKGHTSLIYSIALLPNGNFISSSNDNTLKVWDINTYQEIKSLIGHKDCVYTIIVLKDGKIASFSYDGEIRIWDHNNDYELIKTKKYKDYDCLYNSILLINDCMACSGYYEYSRRIIIIDPSKDYECVGEIEQSTFVASLVNIGHNYFASGDKDSIITIWDINNNYYCLTKLYANNGCVWALLYIEKINSLISGSDNGIKVWNLFDYTCVKTIETVKGITCFALLKGGYFASSFVDGKIEIRDINMLKCIKTLQIGKSRETSILSLDDYRLVSALVNEIIIWNY
jgi:WD40 repeat protein